MSSVQSVDGTRIGYKQMGSGPTVILVDGALTYRAFGAMPSLAELLAPRFTVVTFDRRGRGESGNTSPYAVEREIEDIGALIQAAGSPACLYGISSGACLALQAAVRLDTKVRKLAMYEPPYNSAEPARKRFSTYQKNLNHTLSAGKRGEAVDLFFTLVGRPIAEVEKFHQAPSWPNFEAVAPTLAHDAAAMGADGDVPVDLAARVKVPTLVMDGSASMAANSFMHETAVALAKAIPQARHVTVEAQGHDINLSVLAPILTEFFAS